MSYYDVWKKKMQNSGENATQAIINNSKKIYTNTFKDDPSYKKGILLKSDLTKIEVETRVINVDKTVNEKRIQVLPDNVVSIGDYIEYTDRIYVVTEFEDNYIVPYCKAIKCIQTMNIKGWDKPIPCWGDNTSYGVKGKIDTNFFTTTDGKFQFKVQKNKWTDMLDKDIRIMFNHKYVYRIVECENILNQGIYVVTVDKDEKDMERDNFKNNVAYNECFETDIPINPNPNPQYAYNVIADSGDLTLKKYNANTFRLVDKYGKDVSGVWNITIDYNGLDTKYITVKEKGDNYIKLISSKGYNATPIIITFTKNTNKIEQKVGLIN